MRNHYVVLGVSRKADNEKIKRAYRRVAKKHHPDVNSDEGSRERFLEIRDAYDTLSDEARRREYDRKLKREESAVRIDGKPGETAKRRPEGNRAQGFAPLTADKPLDRFIPPSFPYPGVSENSARRLLYEAILSPEEAAVGGCYPLTVSVVEPCPECAERGLLYGLFCPSCDGYGRIRSQKTLPLSIPPKVRSGTEIRLPLDHPGLQGIYLTVVVRVDPA